MENNRKQKVVNVKGVARFSPVISFSREMANLQK